NGYPGQRLTIRVQNAPTDRGSRREPERNLGDRLCSANTQHRSWPIERALSIFLTGKSVSSSEQPIGTFIDFLELEFPLIVRTRCKRGGLLLDLLLSLRSATALSGILRHRRDNSRQGDCRA